MDIDKDDLAVLSARMTKEEMDRVHRLLHEWGVGPADNFPVQFTLLTSAQLLAAASVPKAIADSRKLLEQHLAEYRRQTKLLLDGFASTGEQQQSELNTALLNHAKTTLEAAEKIQAQIADAEAVAKRVKSLMSSAALDWSILKAETKEQCGRLKQVSNDLEDRFAWQVILERAIFSLLVLALGVLGGHYLWPR
jgi:hypothetical protein